VTIRQDGALPTPCSWTLVPEGAAVSHDINQGTFEVRTLVACGWTAVSNDPWITITSGSQGTGTGTVGYTVSRHTQIAGRTGTIRVGGQTSRSRSPVMRVPASTPWVQSSLIRA